MYAQILCGSQFTERIAQAYKNFDPRTDFGIQNSIPLSDCETGVGHYSSLQSSNLYFKCNSKKTSYFLRSHLNSTNNDTQLLYTGRTEFMTKTDIVVFSDFRAISS